MSSMQIYIIYISSQYFNIKTIAKKKHYNNNLDLLNWIEERENTIKTVINFK